MDIVMDKAANIKAQNILDQANALILAVQEGFQNGTDLHNLEKNLFDMVLTMGHQALELLFELCGSGDMGASVCLEDGREVNRLPTPHVKPYLSIFGPFEISRCVYGSREGQKIEYIPLDAHLNLPRNKFSYLLQDWDQSLAVETPYLRVSETLKRIFGLTVPVHSLERGNQALSCSTESYWDDQVTMTAAKEGQIVVCSADCKGVVIRKTQEEQAAYQRTEADNHKPASLEMAQPKKRSGKKRMAVLGAVYTIDPHERTPEQVLESLFRAPGELAVVDQPQRPKPVGKNIRASMERDKNDTLLPARTEIFNWLAQEQQQRNPSGQQACVLIMDGEEALWAMSETCLTGESNVEVLDLIHACSYVWKAVQALHPGKAVKNQVPIVQGYVEKMLCGGINGVIRSLKWQGTYHCLRGDRLKQLKQTCTYFENNASRMCYDDYLAAGYPVASGVIEGACRHVVVDRMEGTGMRWVMGGAKSMLNLRCIHVSGHWDHFMDYHIQCEQNDIYPVKAANDASFVALKLVG
jgi:hypothetical protein